MSSIAVLPTTVVARATRATYGAFIGAGVATATWASRIPQIRDELGLSPQQLGFVLLAIAVGSLVALPMAGIIVHRFGSQRTVAAMSILLAVALVIVAVGYEVGVLAVVVGFVFLGFANGAWDVAMNVQGAIVERHLGRAIMPRFHAGFSVGTVAGALTGALMVALHVPVGLHLGGAAVLIALTVPMLTRGFVTDDHGDEPVAEEHTGAVGSALARWKEPRTLLIGVCVLAFAFAEGVGNDWIGVAVIDGYGGSAVLGTLAFATFLTAMTLGRWFGPPLLDRYGRVAVVRALCLLAVVGLMLFVFSPWLGLAFVGALLWGAGASLGFPVGMSAAADEPAAAATRVSVVASIGYVAFLGGPPLIGFLGEHVGVLKALTVVAVLLGVAALLAGALRPPVSTAEPQAGAPVEPSAS